MNKNKNLGRAKKTKNDEFYTLYKDVKFELDNYKDKFKDKIILCNCNDKGSAFEKYFKENKDIKELIITEGRFQDNLEALKRCDIVVTNPPFSQFREFIDLLIKYDKDFIIIGSDNAMTYKNIFPLIKNGKIFLGYNKPKKFIESNGNIKKFGNIEWYTTFKTERPSLKLTATYNPKEYFQYDNYNAIEVSKVKDIPKDYNGYMGVPITFLNKWNREQFEIIGKSDTLANKIVINGKNRTGRFYLNGKRLYDRVVIKKKRENIK